MRKTPVPHFDGQLLCDQMRALLHRREDQPMDEAKREQLFGPRTPSDEERMRTEVWRNLAVLAESLTTFVEKATELLGALEHIAANAMALANRGKRNAD